jgi:hypothetical protein
MHTITFFPIGNADCCLIDLAYGQKLLFDYANLRNPDDSQDLRVDLAATIQDKLGKQDYFDVVAFTHADDDHVHGASEFFHLGACRRERSSGHASCCDNARVLHVTGRSGSTEPTHRQNTVSDTVLFELEGWLLPLCYAQDKVWKRLRLKAKQTRHHSPDAAVAPRKENWRKPRTSLMIPITGSTVHLRAP